MERKLKKILHDWVRVRLDETPKEDTSSGGIILNQPVMVHTGVVVETGPGKRYRDEKKYVPIQVQPGERVVFFAGNMDTKQGKSIQPFVEEGEALIPETAILFVLELEDGEAMPRIEK